MDSIQTKRNYSRHDATYNHNRFNCPTSWRCLGNIPFNTILNLFYFACIAKISLPAQFHSISIFLYYSMPEGLTSAHGPRYLCFSGGCGRITIYEPADAARNRNLHSNLIVHRKLTSYVDTPIPENAT